MKKLRFLLVIHNHQPIGNFDYVFENSYQQAYKPFLDVFEKFNLKASLHLSGPLFDWLLENHPEYLERIKKFVAADRIEIIGSGYYEPILAAIPENDAVDQIKLYKKALEKYFATDLNGAWLTERVWEPHLPRIFSRAGIKYLPVDDYHFIRSGFTCSELDGYYLTEFENRQLAIYPGSEKLRYILPFSTVEEVARYFGETRDAGVETLIFADDGEKFGIWPDTHAWVYGEGWLFKFFSFLSENASWIETETLRGHYGNSSPKGCCYLPTTSYPELGEWALPTDASTAYKKSFEFLKRLPNYSEIRPFFQGGQWKNFLAKYRESQFIHKKMHFISATMEGRKPEKKIDLFKGQCNDAYWHGVFGGLYLPHLRRELNARLIAAMDEAFDKPSIEQYDFDLDGRQEIFAINNVLACVLDPFDGGTVSSIDSIPKRLNLTDSFARRKEPYHARLKETTDEGGATRTIHDQFHTKEEGLEKLLHYDVYPKTGFRAHLFQNFDSDRFITVDRGLLHPVATATCACKQRRNKDGFKFSFDSSGPDWSCSKSLVMRYSEMLCSFRIHSTGNYEHAGLEWNFNLFAPDAPDRYIEVNNGVRAPLKTLDTYASPSLVSVVDEWQKVRITMESGGFSSLLVHPLYTVSLSEAGAEKTYQGSCFLFLGKMQDGVFEGTIKITISED